MDFELSFEERLFKETVEEFLRKELKPISKKIDSEERIDKNFIKKMAQQGLLGILNSQKYGGAEGSMLLATIVAEEIGKNDTSLATAVLYLVTTAWGYIFEKYANEEIKEEYIPKVTKGEAFIGICSTEPTGGSDVAAIKTTALKSDEYYIINGEKSYISGVREILENDGGLVTLVKTSIELGYKGISLLFLPIKILENIEISPIKNMGRMGISTSLLKFNNTKVHKKYLLGKENEGFYYAMEGFNTARILVAASCIGAAESVLEEGINYIKNRKAFGQPIGKFEGIQFPLADLYSKLEAVRLLVYKSAWIYDKMRKNLVDKSQVIKYSAMSKLLAPELAIEIISEVMKWLGAYGYTKEAGIEKALRGVYSYYVGAEGAQNIMRIIVAREILGKEFVPYRE